MDTSVAKLGRAQLSDRLTVYMGFANVVRKYTECGQRTVEPVLYSTVSKEKVVRKNTRNNESIPLVISSGMCSA
jgi:hypothetical protein